MVFENRNNMVQMIISSAAQGIGAVGLTTIFEKMELFWSFSRAGVAFEDCGARGPEARQVIARGVRRDG